MAVRTRRLAGPLAVPVAPAVVFTCPADRTALCKWLTIIGLDAPGVSITAYINGTAVGNRVGNWTRDNVGAGQIAIGWVLQEGNTLFIGGGAVGLNITASLHGALLLGDPA